MDFNKFYQAYLSKMLCSRIGRLPNDFSQDQADFDQQVCIHFCKKETLANATHFSYWNQTIENLKKSWLKSKQNRKLPYQSSEDEQFDILSQLDSGVRSAEIQFEERQLIQQKLSDLSDGFRIAALILFWPEFEEFLTDKDRQRLSESSGRSLRELQAILDDDQVIAIDKLILLYYHDLDSNSQEYKLARAAKLKEIKRAVSVLSNAFKNE